MPYVSEAVLLDPRLPPYLRKIAIFRQRLLIQTEQGVHIWIRLHSLQPRSHASPGHHAYYWRRC